MEFSKMLLRPDIENRFEIPDDWRLPRETPGRLHVVDEAGFFWEFWYHYETRGSGALTVGPFAYDITSRFFEPFEWRRYVQYTGALPGDHLVLKVQEGGGFRGIKLRIELRRNPNSRFRNS